MKIIVYSDLHLERSVGFTLPPDNKADLLILAGDIVNFLDWDPLDQMLENWKKPVLFVPGNHEYYNRTSIPMKDMETLFKQWLKEYYPNVRLLQNEAITINGINFFGGTMWTDFDQSNEEAMQYASKKLNDFNLIYNQDYKIFIPEDAVRLHEIFTRKLKAWFQENLQGPRVVISHHAPVLKHNTKYSNKLRNAAFNSLDMTETIERYQPNLWIYGHTHECDQQSIGRTSIISNQRGYYNCLLRVFECPDFDEDGTMTEIKTNTIKPIVSPGFGKLTA